MTQDLTGKTIEVQIDYYYSRLMTPDDADYNPDEPTYTLERDEESSKHVTLEYMNEYQDDEEVEPYEAAADKAIRLLQDPFGVLDIEIEKYPGEKGDWKMYAKEEEFPREDLRLHFYSDTVDTRWSEGAVDVEVEIREVDGWDIAELMEIWRFISGKEVKPVEVDLTTTDISDDEKRIEQLEMEFESYLMHHPDAPRDYMTISIILGKSDEYYALLDKFNEL